MKESLPANRARFTIAHELGHLTIPWQFGSFSFCHSRITHRFDDEVLRKIETDANYFAAELLVPLSWVESRLPSATDSLAAWLVSLAAEARVSIIVAMISAVRAFPPGILFVLTDADGSTTYVGLSPDSDVPTPGRGDPFDVAAYAQVATSYTAEAYGGGSKLVHAFAYSSAVELSEPHEEDCSALLNGILNDLGLDGETRQSARNQVNGVIGNVHNRMREAGRADAALALVLQRFAGRTIAGVSHQAFRSYLECRARAAVAPPKAKKPGRPRKASKGTA